MYNVQCTWKEIIQGFFPRDFLVLLLMMMRWTREYTQWQISLNNFTLQNFTHTNTVKYERWEKKKTNLCVYFFSSLNISFFSTRSFRFRYFVCHLIFRLRWWRITLTNQIYSEAEFFSLALSIQSLLGRIVWKKCHNQMLFFALFLSLICSIAIILTVNQRTASLFNHQIHTHFGQQKYHLLFYFFHSSAFFRRFVLGCQFHKHQHKPFASSV